MRAMNYFHWRRKYGPLTNHLDPNASFERCMFETYGAELEFVRSVPDSRIWTLVEGDTGTLYIVDGFHFVNRLGYFITANPIQACDEGRGVLY